MRSALPLGSASDRVCMSVGRPTDLIGPTAEPTAGCDWPTDLIGPTAEYDCSSILDAPPSLPGAAPSWLFALSVFTALRMR